MLLTLFAALIDGVGYGSDLRAFHDPQEARFPQGVLDSFPWEGWWQEEASAP
jgi:hypothetical protein